MRLEHSPSPNHDARRHKVDLLVLHYTGMQSGQAALDRMRDPEAKVSAHYMVWEDGRIVQLVEDSRRAWHAGVSSWNGDDDLNSRSIGIEIVNGGHDFPLPGGALPPYPDVQIDAVISLAQTLVTRHDIPQSRVVAHSDIAPKRKIDPGEHFPWPRLAAAGIGLWPEEASGAGCVWMGGDPGGLNRQLGAIGYDISDVSAALRAFQRRFLPDAVTGLADARTLRRLAHVAEAYSGTSTSSPQA
ncbi:N-acetylmuramoyl-L-alanine amidase [Hyphomonas sp.]|uniref:N-acetylmuramoyl-L-alanine amidase n=1 Tax=Hyphomonas sp. TaxID=87 RepID=UPI003919F17B